MDQKKELLNKNDKINCLKKELNKMKLIVAKKGEELFEDQELLEMKRNATTKSQDRIHNERMDRKNQNDINALNKKLQSDVITMCNEVTSV